jgi:hypothetical protein
METVVGHRFDDKSLSYKRRIIPIVASVQTPTNSPCINIRDFCTWMWFVDLNSSLYSVRSVGANAKLIHAVFPLRILLST